MQNNYLKKSRNEEPVNDENLFYTTGGDTKPPTDDLLATIKSELDSLSNPIPNP
jgi:hypothetical protein